MTDAGEDSENTAPVVHIPAEHRFVVDLGEQRAMLVYRVGAGEITLLHTEVLAAWEGRGIGTHLTKAALDYAREAGLTVVPRCPFVAAYVREHPEYLALVRQEYREKLRGA
jgi:uncharacterized protein